MANQDDAKLMLTAADECNRFYNGMMNWKANAQAKDRTIIELRETSKAAQVPAAEVRAVEQRLDEMQAIIRAGSYWNGNEQAFADKTESDVAMLDDLLSDVFRKLRSRAQQSTADKACEVRAADLEREIAQLKERLEKKHKSHFITSQALHNVIVGNQSAWIEWQHGAGAEAAMTWIHNGLAGPGLIPDGKEAQPWFDANQDDRYEIPPMKEAGAAPSTADSANTGALGEGAEA